MRGACWPAAWPLGQDCPLGQDGPRGPFMGAAGSPAFHLAGARGAETSRGSGFALSFPWPQEAPKGTQATSLGLSTSVSTHCHGLGPMGPNLPDFCLSPTPPVPLRLRSTAAAGVPPVFHGPQEPVLPPYEALPGLPPLAPGELSHPRDSSLPLFVTQVLAQSPLARERRLLTVLLGAGGCSTVSPSQYLAKVTKTHKKPACRPARL